jgi:hypothetical protein
MAGERSKDKITELEAPLYIFPTNIIMIRVAGHVVRWERLEMPIIIFKNMNLKRLGKVVVDGWIILKS